MTVTPWSSTYWAVDMPALIAGKEDLVEALRGEKYVDVADSYGWKVRRGEAIFAGTPESPLLEVTGTDGTVEVMIVGGTIAAFGIAPALPMRTCCAWAERQKHIVKLREPAAHLRMVIEVR